MSTIVNIVLLSVVASAGCFMLVMLLDFAQRNDKLRDELEERDRKIAILYEENKKLAALLNGELP